MNGMDQGSALCEMQNHSTPLQLTFSTGREQALHRNQPKKPLLHSSGLYIQLWTQTLQGTFCEGLAQVEVGAHKAHRA